MKENNSTQLSRLNNLQSQICATNNLKKEKSNIVGKPLTGTNSNKNNNSESDDKRMTFINITTNWKIPFSSFKYELKNTPDDLSKFFGEKYLKHGLKKREKKNHENFRT